MTYTWDPNKTEEAVNVLMKTLGEEYPLKVDAPEATKIVFISSPKTDTEVKTTRISDTEWQIEYSSITAAARGVSSVLGEISVEESQFFNSFGIMLDCSRDMVMTIPALKKYLRRLALFGYNMLMLYTEDTYMLPDEPYFGYMRGRYTMDDIKEIDRYAAKLGIEVIGCIQTLGHLEQMLRWMGPYNEIKDTSSVIRTDKEKSYELIRKMIVFWSEALQSRRIHVGMDETHDLGRGWYMDYNGYTPPFELFNNHVVKVNAICKEAGLEPMIWSDMYFRMSNPEQKYYTDAPVPADVQAKIPKDVRLVYWDYYHKDEEFYAKFIQRHRDLGYDPVMASGIWTWVKLWYDYDLSKDTIIPCLDACRKMKVKDLFFTMWGDDGAYCDWFSSLAGLCFAAERGYGNSGNESARFRAVCNATYSAAIRAGDIHHPFEQSDGKWREIFPASMLWDDPLLNIVFRNELLKDENFAQRMIDHYTKLSNDLEPYRNEKSAGNMENLLNLTAYLIEKVKFQRDLLSFYKANDHAGLMSIAATRIPELQQKLRTYELSMREVWFSCGKPFGWEVLQIRNAGQYARLEECAIRIKEFLSGKVATLAELDEELPTGSMQLDFTRYKFGHASGSLTLTN